MGPSITGTGWPLAGGSCWLAGCLANTRRHAHARRSCVRAAPKSEFKLQICLAGIGYGHPGCPYSPLPAPPCANRRGRLGPFGPLGPLSRRASGRSLGDAGARPWRGPGAAHAHPTVQTGLPSRSRRPAGQGRAAVLDPCRASPPHIHIYGTHCGTCLVLLYLSSPSLQDPPLGSRTPSRIPSGLLGAAVA